MSKFDKYMEDLKKLDNSFNYQFCFGLANFWVEKNVIDDVLTDINTAESFIMDFCKTISEFYKMDIPGLYSFLEIKKYNDINGGFLYFELPDAKINGEIKIVILIKKNNNYSVGLIEKRRFKSTLSVVTKKKHITSTYRIKKYDDAVKYYKEME